MKSSRMFFRALLAAIMFTSSSTLSAQEIGLQLYSLRNEFKTDVPGTLAQIQKWGIKEIEGGGTYGMPIEDFKKLLKQYNLKTVSVGADFQKLSDDPQSIIENAKAFGAKFVVCFWIPHNGDEFTSRTQRKQLKFLTKPESLCRRMVCPCVIIRMDMNSDRMSRVHCLTTW